MSSDLIVLKEFDLKTGPRLIIRKPSEEDASIMIRYLNNVGGESDNLLFGKDEFYLTAEKEAEYIGKMNLDPNNHMIIGLINGKIVSVAQITSSGKKRIAHNSELAISVKKDYWGIGIGSAMMEELLRFAREHEVIKTISLGVKASNSNAIKLYEKFGFKQVGLHRNYFNINDIYHDEILMDLYLLS